MATPPTTPAGKAPPNQFAIRLDAAGTLQICTSCHSGVPTKVYPPAGPSPMSRFLCNICAQTELGGLIANANGKVPPETVLLAKGTAQAINIMMGKVGAFNAEIQAAGMAAA